MKRKYSVKDRKKLQALSTLWNTRFKLFKACLHARRVLRKEIARQELAKQFKMTQGNELAWKAQVKLWLMKMK